MLPVFYISVMKELKRLLPYIKKHRMKIVSGFIFVTISNIASTYVPRIIGKSIDIIKSGNYEISQIVDMILMILGLTLCSGIFMFLTRRTIIVASRLIEYELRNDYLHVVEFQPMKFFDKNSTGSLMAYATNDITAAREFMGPAVMWGANTITSFVFVLYYMITLNPSITLYSILPMPLIAVSVYFLGSRVHITFRAVQDKFSDLTAFAQESISGIRVIKAYVRGEYEVDEFSKESGDYKVKNLKYAKIQSAMMPLLMVLIGLSQLIMLGYGGVLVTEGRATLGDLAQFFIYLNMLIWPVAAIGWITNVVQRASASAARLGRIFDSAEQTEEPFYDGAKDVDFTSDIVYKSITFSYDKELKPALENIDLKIPGKTSLGITGRIGSGKSTLVNLIPRLYAPDSGSITIGGTNIDDIPVSFLRENIGFVPQEPYLFSMTITENIKFGIPDASPEDIVHVSKIVELHDEIEEFENRYESVLGERGITLSGGQKQRLALARALLKKPSIIILDDAFSAVDSDTEEKIHSNLKKYFENRTVITISHRISTIKNSDKIIYLSEGKIVEAGTHEELLLLNGNYHRLYQRQQLEEEIKKL